MSIKTFRSFIAFPILLRWFFFLGLLNASSAYSMNTPGSPVSAYGDSISGAKNIEAYCSNNWMTMAMNESSPIDCDNARCSDDPQVASNCCKCKPECCDYCTTNTNTTSSNDDDNAICPPKELKSRIPGLVGYCVGALLLLIACAIQAQHPSQVLSSEKEQIRRKQQFPVKFHIQTITEETMKHVAQSEAMDDDDDDDDLEDSRNNPSALEEEAETPPEKIDDTKMYDIYLEIDNSTSSNTGANRCLVDEELGLGITTAAASATISEDQSLSKGHGIALLLDAGIPSECSICLELYKVGDTICVSNSIDCDHVFHKECVSEWLSQHNHCPLCRVDLMSANKKKTPPKRIASTNLA